MPKTPMPETDLARLQRLLISKSLLPANGDDGAWGPKTKAAFDAYLASTVPIPSTHLTAGQHVLGADSLAKLTGVHPSLVAVVKRAIQITPQDFSVEDGIRTIERQRTLVAKGASKTMASKHLRQADGFGHAVDLVPYDEGPRWEWSLIWPVAAAVQEAAIELGTQVRWGAVWDQRLNDLPRGVDGLKRAVEAYKVRHAGPDFLDGPHYELV